VNNEVSRPIVRDSGPFYHGTRADLSPGDLLGAGYASNYGERKAGNFVYMSSKLDTAVWGAELAVGEGHERIYVVEPTGPFEDDPNVTNKREPGNPTRSYRSRDELRVLDEVTEWERHPPELLRAMRDRLQELRRLGLDAIIE
jgi:rifampin ADP-ribosylating transferase